jgi:hypothetical protein
MVSIKTRIARRYMRRQFRARAAAGMYARSLATQACNPDDNR